MRKYNSIGTKLNANQQKAIVGGAFALTLWRCTLYPPPGGVVYDMCNATNPTANYVDCILADCYQIGNCSLQSPYCPF